MAQIKVKSGNRITDFGDERLKTELHQSTKLSIDQVNKVVDMVKIRLLAREQPIYPHDIATTAFVVMMEQGMKRDAEAYYAEIKGRFEGRFVPKEKITFIECDHCRVSNSVTNAYCIGCGAPLDKNDTKSKII